ncbi:MAG: HNH endonuclease [Planctomycetota bacterium]
MSDFRVFHRPTPGRCEYCRMHQVLQGATFHVEHVVPRCLRGQSVTDNLAWACPSCNLHKSNRVAVRVSGTDHAVPLFNPRVDNWADHFCWDGYHIVVVTLIGRATVDAFLLNSERRILIRQAEALFNLFPPV